MIDEPEKCCSLIFAQLIIAAANKQVTNARGLNNQESLRHFPE